MKTNKSHVLKIGYRSVPLKFVKKIDSNGTFGEYDWEKGLIRVRKGLTEREKANTILHELNHAILNDFEVKLGDDTEERIVYAFTNGLMAFAINNKKFFNDLMKLVLKQKRMGKVKKKTRKRSRK